MELRVLRYFLAVVREENILRASEVLHITQPSLSRQLAQMEEELGARLFERGNRKITLTEAGMLLRRRAEELVALADKTEQEFAELSGGDDVSGIISIGSGEISAVSELAKMIKAFSEDHSNISFNFYSGNADNIKDQIDQGLLDFGLLLEPVEMEKYDYLRMPVKEHWVVVVPKGSPLAEKASVTPQDLQDTPLILPSRDRVKAELANWLGSSFDKKNVFSSNNLINNAALLVEQGLGVALSIQGAVSLYGNDKVCVRPLYPDLISTSVIVWKKHQPMGVAATKFLDRIRMSIEHTKV
ncbi:MAG: LysR family transcriptional regulator [Clostridiales bacterium]|nr:LysR family transcriptional regulator [Clostridiales bacterium]